MMNAPRSTTHSTGAMAISSNAIIEIVIVTMTRRSGRRMGTFVMISAASTPPAALKPRITPVNVNESVNCCESSGAVINSAA